MFYPVITLLLWVRVALASGLERVNDYTFDHSVIQSGDYVLVDFYADWCRHCQKLMPIVERLAETYQDVEGIKVVKHNGGERSGKKMVKKYDIEGFPMLTLFHGNDEPIMYEGSRDFESISNFISLATGIRKQESNENNGELIGSGSFIKNIIRLDDSNIEDQVLRSTKKSLVMVSGDWCKHCKAMKPILEQANNVYQFDEELQFGIVNVDNQRGTTDTIKSQFQIKELPTILLFDPTNVGEDGLRRPIPYDGARTLPGVINFINKNLNYHRQANGRLTSTAGVIATLDDDIAELLENKHVDIAIRLLDELPSHSSDQFAVDYYRKLINKVINNEHDYFLKEYNRLNNIITTSKSNIQMKTIDSIDTKINILKRFI